jgi:hypothetical protein
MKGSRQWAVGSGEKAKGKGPVAAILNRETSNVKRERVRDGVTLLTIFFSALFINSISSFSPINSSTFCVLPFALLTC